MPCERFHEDDGLLLAHHYLLVMRGAERTFEAMTACYPDATIATLLYDPVRTEGRFANRRVRTSSYSRSRPTRGAFDGTCRYCRSRPSGCPSGTLAW